MLIPFAVYFLGPVLGAMLLFSLFLALFGDNAAMILLTLIAVGLAIYL